MNEYYYLNAQNQQQGPVPAEQLVARGVTRNTKVWTQGMAGWQSAGDVPELVSLFEQPGNAVPPPPPPHHVPPVPPTGETKPDNLLVWAIVATVLCCLPTGIAAIIYSNKVDPLWNEGRYEESKKAAANAKMWCLISVGAFLVCSIFGFIIGFLSAL